MLENIFHDLLNTLQISPNKNAWTLIHKNYTAPTRHYHNISHLEKMYGELLTIKESMLDWNSILISLFYHDVIYDSAKQDNELQSALFMERELERSQFKNIETCKAQILATKKHERSNCEDTNYLLDADLSILGSSWTDYENYSQQVRQEYIQYPDEVYRPGRKKVLEHFIKRDNIYQTSVFKDKYEARARINLQKEIDNIAV